MFIRIIDDMLLKIVGFSVALISIFGVYIISCYPGLLHTVVYLLLRQRSDDVSSIPCLSDGYTLLH